MKVKFKSELLFRRAIIPWYDTDPAMLLTLAFAVATLLFSLFGVAAVLDTPHYHAAIWVPGLLGILSLTITISMLIRLIGRS